MLHVPASLLYWKAKQRLILEHLEIETVHFIFCWRKIQTQCNMLQLCLHTHLPIKESLWVWPACTLSHRFLIGKMFPIIPCTLATCLYSNRLTMCEAWITQNTKPMTSKVELKWAGSILLLLQSSQFQIVYFHLSLACFTWYVLYQLYVMQIYVFQVGE